MNNDYQLHAIKLLHHTELERLTTLELLARNFAIESQLDDSRRELASRGHPEHLNAVCKAALHVSSPPQG